MRRAAVVLILLAATAAADPGTAAARGFRPCGLFGLVQCRRVVVPLDRTGAVPGVVSLRVRRVRAFSRRASGRRAVLALAGGPGESAVPLLLDSLGSVAPALRSRDLLTFDQRGTGGSGLLRCASFERLRIGTLRDAARRCAKSLGPARSLYRTFDSVEDIEAVRKAAGISRLTLFGVSYGTRVALDYARAHPDRVERLVLDSVVDPAGRDAFDLDLFSAVPRVLRELCAAGRCRGVTGDPVADLESVVRAIAANPLRGYVVGDDGRRRARKLGRLRLLDLLLTGDFNDAARTALPGAIRSARQGDAPPLLRLTRDALTQDAGEPLSVFDGTTFVATSCADGGFPWDPAATFSARWGQALGAAALVPDDAFAPFDRPTARASALLRACAAWPAVPPGPDLSAAALPDVPTLILEGSADLRTPVEGAGRLAGEMPRASLFVVPGAGHSVLAGDPSGCALVVVDRFFSGRKVGSRCPRSSRAVLRALRPERVDPVAPASLADLGPATGLGGRRGRSVRAAGLSVADALGRALPALALGSLFATDDRPIGIGALRSGRLLLRVRRPESYEFDRYSYVPGTWVSSGRRPLSSLLRRIRLRVGGPRAAHGSLVFDFQRNRIRGRVGGHAVRMRLERTLDRTIGALYAAERGAGAAERRRWRTVPRRVLRAVRRQARLARLP